MCGALRRGPPAPEGGGKGRVAGAALRDRWPPISRWPNPGQLGHVPVALGARTHASLKSSPRWTGTPLPRDDLNLGLHELAAADPFGLGFLRLEERRLREAVLLDLVCDRIAIGVPRSRRRGE